MTATPTHAPKTAVANRLFFVFGGPKFDLDSFGSRFEKLSERYQGVCVTGAQEASDKYYGRFRIVTVSWRDGRLFNIRLLHRCLLVALRERFQGRAPALVVTSDPLKSGLYGYLVARLTGAKLAPEVNGDYARDANYRDTSQQADRKRRQVLRLAKFVITRADGVRLLHSKQIDFVGDRIAGKVVRVVPEFVDVRPFRDLGEEKVVLFVGFPFFLKGVDLLIAAFKRIATKHPQWKLKILGWYPDPTTLFAHIDNHPQIFHHPPVKHGEMPAHIGRCAILVLPSRSEAMGRVLLEAAAAGKARIGSNIGGIPTVIADGKDGLLFEPENVSQLSKQLDRLMTDDALRGALGRAARARLLSEFTVDRYLERIGDFYAGVIAHDGARGIVAQGRNE